MTFSQWMTAVNAALRERTGLTTRDLPGLDYHGLYLDGYTADEVAAMAAAWAADGRTVDVDEGP
jgi:hypothetical protein